MIFERGESAPLEGRGTRVIIVEFSCSGDRSFLDGLKSEFNTDRASSFKELADLLHHRTYAVAVLANGASPDGKANFLVDLEAAGLIHKVQSACQLLFLARSDLDLDSSCRAVKAGAAGFVNADQVASVTERVRELSIRWEEQRDQIRQLRESDFLDQSGIATQSRTMLKLLAQARKAAQVCDAPIIIEGESGTGKQLLAEAIHKMDPKRGKRAFIPVNCAAITGTLAESSLFGHKKGAFTGATEDRLGYFRAANGGTLMLDEISELEGPLQPKLLRVLQEGKVLPVGDDREQAVDVRIIASSNKRLSEQVVQGRFRLDLYQRLNVIRLHLPPLRERVEDIPLLVRFFLEKYSHYYGEKIEQVEGAVYAVLQRAVGEGNVRELENIIRQALAFKTSGTTLGVVDLPELVREKADGKAEEIVPTDLAGYITMVLERGPVDLGRLVEDYECQILRTAMRDLGLRGTHLARHLSLNRRTLYHKLKRYQLLEPS